MIFLYSVTLCEWTHFFSCGNFGIFFRYFYAVSFIFPVICFLSCCDLETSFSCKNFVICSLIFCELFEEDLPIKFLSSPFVLRVVCMAYVNHV